MKAGIYTITCSPTNKMYVGYASNWKSRLWSHKFFLKHGKHDNEYLQRAWNKYGENNFKFELLEECNPDLMVAMEHYWVTTLCTYNRKYGYNILPTNPNLVSSTHSAETKLKISKALKGREISDICRRTLREMASRPHSDKRKAQRKEWFAKNKHPMKGRTHTNEAKNKIGDAKRGKPSNNRKKVIAIDNGKETVFNSISEAAIYYSVLITSISNNLAGKSKGVGKTKIKFKYG